MKEHFDQGARGDSQHPNKWPAESVLPGFRKNMEDAFETLEQVSAKIMEALEVALKLPRGAFLDRITHKGNASEMRLNHYPAIDITEIKGGSVSRIWPHFDLGVITLLFQDGVGGLEFENRAQRGTFSRVECGAPSEMIVNVSETLQRWTNDCLRAGLHRVNVPENMEDEETGTLPERYSIAYFCKADRGASVGPLKQFVLEGTDPVYQDMKAIEYHQQRLQSAY
jgi:isopenicillin N synthase-like dioxygenase